MKDTKKVIDLKEELRLAIIAQNKKRDSNKEARFEKVIGTYFK